MNLGLTLIKPAESDLGIAMRLWLANRATWTLSPSGWRQRVAAGIASNPELKRLTLPQNVRGLNAVRYLEAHLQGRNTKMYLGLAGHSFSHRNCPECAWVGYHCIYFDYPWLARCPIHNKALVSNCPDCGSPWPSANDVHTRKCDCCGIRKPIEKIIENGGFDTDNFRLKITRLVAFFSSTIECLQSRRSFNLYVQAEHNDQFARTLVFPSVLASQLSLSESELQYLKDLGLAPQDCHKKSVDAKAKTRPLLTCLDLKESSAIHRCRNRIFRLVNRALKHHSGHRLGACQRNEIHRHFECVYCESWRQWNKGFERHIENNTSQYMFTYHLPFARRVNVRDPGLVTSLYDYGSSTEYQVPERTQRLIYQVELWLCFRKMMSQVEFYLSHPFDLKQSYASYRESDRAYLSHEHHHFGYFYFVKQADHINLVFPKSYVDANLNNNEELLSLFREPI